MRVLVIARHAKAEAHVSGPGDHARALALQGRGDAKVLGEQLKAAGFMPDVALVSDANRTMQTWKLAAQAWDDVEVRYREDLYETTVGTMVDAIAAAPAGADNVMIVAHEPTVSSAATFLAGKGSAQAALQRVAHGLPTGMAAVLEYDGDWADVERGSMRLRAIVGRGE